MTPHLDDELAGLLLGEPDERLRQEASAHLQGCPPCRAAYAGGNDALGRLAAACGVASAPDKARLLSSIEHVERFAPHAGLVASSLAISRDEARRVLHLLSLPEGWLSVPTLAGLLIRPVLLSERGQQREIEGAVLAQVDPGRKIPRHLHHGPETMVVLQGELADVDQPGRQALGPGGVLASADGSLHELLVPPSSEACLCLVVNQGWPEYL